MTALDGPRTGAPLASRVAPVRDGQAKPGAGILASEGEYRDPKQGMPSPEALSASLTGAEASGRGMLPGERRRTGEALGWPGICLRGGTGSE